MSLALTTAVRGQARHLDEFFTGQATWPDPIKIDVEGAELDVLQGARQNIAQHHPVMFVEVHPRLLGNFGASSEQVYAFLRAHGNTIQRWSAIADTAPDWGRSPRQTRCPTARTCCRASDLPADRG